MLYPLVFRPLYHERVWGGRVLQELYGKDLPADLAIGESWEIVDRPGAVSVIANGPLAGKDLHWLVDHHAEELLGAAALVQGRFPLLVKILDARQALSLQVHPPASVAPSLGGEPKTEVWYVAQAAEDARLFAGLKRGVTRSTFEEGLRAGTVAECLHQVPVKAGSAMFLPSGRVHALGAGLVVFEIQQNSDTTYRVFDWNRVGTDGKPRELHLPSALASINFEDHEPGLVSGRFERRRAAQARTLVEDPLFSVEEFQVDAEVQVPFFGSDRPTILGVVSGQLAVNDEVTDEAVCLRPGQWCLIPAAAEEVELRANQASVGLLAAPGERPLELPEPTVGTGRQVVQAWQHYRPRPKRGSAYKPGTIPSRRRLKKLLSKRFTYAPFLKMLIFKTWFRVAVLGLLAMVIFLGLFLPKMWRATPKDFLPVVRISWLDRVQAFMLRRTAEGEQAARRYEDAAYAWQSAIANNPGDPELLRGQVRCALATEPPSAKFTAAAVRNSFWLLRLTRTNQMDLELTVNLLEKLRLHGFVVQRLQPLATNLPAQLQPAYLKALFHERQMEEFQQRWKQLAPSRQAEPELALYGAAYLAGWGAPDQAGEAGRLLGEAAAADSPQRVTANRLQLMVATQLQDAEGFSAALQRLEQQHADTGLDHVLYWRMLAGLGRNKEAVELARAYAYPPTSAAEVARLTDAYSLLGLKDQALQLMQRYAPQFGYAEDIWISYANLLIDLKRWDELRATALEIRHQESVRERLEGFSFFLEGRADYEQSRSAPAAAAFDRAAGCAFPNPLLGLAAARQLVRAGFPGPARLILGKLETQLADNPDFREAAFNAALLLKDEEWLFKVARQQFQSQPRNAIYLNRYAAAFLIQRAQPEEAIKLTLQLVTAFPNSAAANVNHALALLLNRREAEAERLLGRLKLEALRDTEIHAYHLARFELCLLQGKPAEAWLAYDKIDQQALFPGQKRWIEECRAKLPPRGAAAP